VHKWESPGPGLNGQETPSHTFKTKTTSTVLYLMVLELDLNLSGGFRMASV